MISQAAYEGMMMKHADQEQRIRELENAIKLVIDTFARDEEQGYRSRDKRFAIEILGKALGPVK